MQNTPLRNKSEMLAAAAQLLHENCYYNAVAHAAYYSCYQIMKHIWIYSMNRTQGELDSQTSQSKMGSHEYLLNEVVKFISVSQKRNSQVDVRSLRNEIPQLKKLRVDADYSDTTFDISKSSKTINMSSALLTILKRY